MGLDMFKFQFFSMHRNENVTSTNLDNRIILSAGRLRDIIESSKTATKWTLQCDYCVYIRLTLSLVKECLNAPLVYFQ